MSSRASVLAFLAGSAAALAAANADDRQSGGWSIQGVSVYTGGELRPGLYSTDQLYSALGLTSPTLRGPGGGMPIPFTLPPWFIKNPQGSTGSVGPGPLPNSIEVVGDNSDPNGQGGGIGGFVGLNTFVQCPPSVLPLCAVTFTLNEYISADIQQWDLPVFKLVDTLGDNLFGLADPRGPHAGSPPFGIPNIIDNDNQLPFDPIGFSYTFVLGPSVDGPYHIGLGVFSADGAFGAGIAIFSNVFAEKIIPAPGGIALLGIGGLLAARRRRA